MIKKKWDREVRGKTKFWLENSGNNENFCQGKPGKNGNFDQGKPGKMEILVSNMILEKQLTGQVSVRR